MLIKLKTKIWLTVLVIVLMFSYFILYYFPARQETYLLRSYDNEVKNVANTVAVGVEIAINEQNFRGITKEIEIVKNDSRLSFVRLVEEDTVWDKGHQQYVIRDSILKTFPENAALPAKISSNDSMIVKRASLNTKIMNGNGAILVGFKTNEITETIRRIRMVSLAISGVVCLIAILIGFWLSRNISIPVLSLREAAIKVGEGDLTQHVKTTSRDEIGELAKAFNKMVDDLARAREQLKQANLNLASTNETLNKTVEDLKAAQEQLIQAEKMASLGQLTAGIAHEINNPINFVSANIQPLKDDMADIIRMSTCYEQVIKEKNLQKEFESLDAFKKEYNIDVTMKEVHDLLRGMEEGANRTSEIVKGLRNFSRLDQNVFKLANLNDNLESTLVLLHSAYKNRIDIFREYGDIPEVDCYPGQINQVFMNILSNAIQAIPKEGSIYIKTWQAGDQVKISIKDTGSGIPDHVRKKIFDPFFTTKEIGKGTGLGLSISYGIIQKHNGEIEVFSKPGEGTEFIINIPIKQEITV
ncbi:MAG TPA: ATP-binding protein [Puia sp.]|nr:ATP-binding protein [Puia sp.]